MQHDSPSPDHTDESYFASFTDLLVGILFTFIILLMIVASNFQDATESIKKQKAADLVAKINNAREKALDEARTNDLRNNLQNLFFSDRLKILSAIGKELQDQGIAVTVNVNKGTLKFPESTFFSGEDDKLSAPGQQALRAVAATLGKYLPCISPTKDPLRLAACAGLALDTTDALDAIFIVDHPDPKSSAEIRWLQAVQRTVTIFSTISHYDPYLYKDLKNITGVPILNVTAHQARRQVQKAEQQNPNLKQTVEFKFVTREPTRRDIDKLREAQDMLEMPEPAAP